MKIVAFGKHVIFYYLLHKTKNVSLHPTVQSESTLFVEKASSKSVKSTRRSKSKPNQIYVNKVSVKPFKTNVCYKLLAPALTYTYIYVIYYTYIYIYPD